MTSGDKLVDHLPDLQKHFWEFGSIIMMGKTFSPKLLTSYIFCNTLNFFFNIFPRYIFFLFRVYFLFPGGDSDNASKGIVGVSIEKKSLLVVVSFIVIFWFLYK